MKLKNDILGAIAEQTGLPRHDLDGLSIDIADWCTGALAGDTHNFELIGWLLIARKESNLRMLLAPATTAIGTQVITANTEHKIIVIDLN